MFAAAGFTGCVLKGHCEPTAGRAVAAGAGSGVVVFGGIVLNHAVGGINAAAVSATLALGGRIVWMPTLDAHAHHVHGLPLPDGWRTGGGLAVPPVDNRHVGAVDDILRLVAEADAVLATGHLGPAECGWLVRRARAAGVRRVLLTHPTFAVPGLAPAEVEELCAMGAIAEITAYQMLGGDDPAPLAALAGRLGPDRCVLSSDAGQPESPPPPEALTLLVERLVSAGLDAGAAHAMASETPERLLG